MKTKLKSLLAIVLLGSAITTRSQNVSYQIIENDPDKRNLFIHLNPFNTQAYLSDITIGYNIQATWLAAKHLQFQVDYRKAYLDENATGIFSPVGLKKSSQLEIGGIFNIVNKKKNKSHRIVLKSSSSGRYTYTSSIYVTGEARKIIGFRGGLLTLFSNHKVNNDFTKKADGMQGKRADGTVSYLRDSINFETINFTARSIGLYGGIDFKTIKQLIVSAEGYGTKSNKIMNNFYLDVLFTPLVKYDLKLNTGQAYMSNVDINIPENKRKILGWRLGWQYTLNQPCGFNAKMELGQQPGLASKSFFLTFGFGMTIGLKTKELPI
ncbi:MAG: hypothetical protein H0U95_19170 [Bacteroidetes bacterium]|nr:hypothetical protein [Bacteroidota bacterium]